MISKYVAMHRKREILGMDSIEICATQIEGSNAGYSIKFASGKGLDNFLRNNQINLINAIQKTFVDRKSGKAFIKFKFIDDPTYPYTPAIKIKLNVKDETLASNIYNQFMVQAFSATSNVNRGMEHGVLSK